MCFWCLYLLEEAFGEGRGRSYWEREKWLIRNICPLFFPMFGYFHCKLWSDRCLSEQDWGCEIALRRWNIPQFLTSFPSFATFRQSLVTVKYVCLVYTDSLFMIACIFLNEKKKKDIMNKQCFVSLLKLPTWVCISHSRWWGWTPSDYKSCSPLRNVCTALNEAALSFANIALEQYGGSFNTRVDSQNSCFVNKVCSEQVLIDNDS